MTFFRFAYVGPTFVPLSALVLAILTHGAPASAQAPEARSERHHVDAMLGLGLRGTTSVESASCALDQVCSSSAPVFPPGGVGYAVRVGYRFRPIAYFEIGASPEASFHEDGKFFALPLMLYGRLPLRGGASFTLGVGGGVAQARGDGGVRQTDAIGRIELAAVIPVGGAWSVQILAHGTQGLHTFARTPEDVFREGERLSWLGLAFGPRYSF